MNFTYVQLKQAISNLTHTTSMMLDIVSEKDTTNIPKYRIRYMNTAGGLQFCIKECDYRGESSGRYFPLNQIDEFTDYVFKTILKKYCRLEEFKKRIKHSTTSEKWNILIRSEEKLQNEHSAHLENSEVFKNSKVFTLEL